MDVIKGIANYLDKLIEPARNWLFENYNNPFLGVTLFIIGILIFRAVYGALNKDK